MIENININFSDLRDNGIVKVKKFLNSKELFSLQNILADQRIKKNDPKSYFSINYKLLSFKLLKFNFLEFNNHLYILNLAKNKKLSNIANEYFKKRSYLKFIDSYHSPISNKDVLPWHTDQAYEGDEKNYSGFVNPDYAHVKFFIYLTEIGPNNGCMSYIPGSHKIGYALRKGIYEKKINFDSYYLFKDFRYLVKKNIKYLNQHFKDQNFVNNFLNSTEIIEKEPNNSKFDYSLSAGDAIIFDEGGVHKGSKSQKNERIVLRYLYSIKK